MKKLENIIKFIEKGIDDFKKAPYHSFREIIKPNWRPKKGAFESPGIYAIYEKNKELIYVGMAGKSNHYLKYRLSDLFYESKYRKNKFKHSLSEQLLTKIKRFKNINLLRKFYLEKCSVKIIETLTVREARILESILIELLVPKYNQE